jgi:hypothetical protein
MVLDSVLICTSLLAYLNNLRDSPRPIYEWLITIYGSRYKDAALILFRGPDNIENTSNILLLRECLLSRCLQCFEQIFILLWGKNSKYKNGLGNAHPAHEQIYLQLARADLCRCTVLRKFLDAP